MTSARQRDDAQCEVRHVEPKCPIVCSHNAVTSLPMSDTATLWNAIETPFSEFNKMRVIRSRCVLEIPDSGVGFPDKVLDTPASRQTEQVRAFCRRASHVC